MRQPGKSSHIYYLSGPYEKQNEKEKLFDTYYMLGDLENKILF